MIAQAQQRDAEARQKRRAGSQWHFQAGVELVANGLRALSPIWAGPTRPWPSSAARAHRAGLSSAKVSVILSPARCGRSAAMAVTAMADAGKAVTGFLTDSVDVAGDFEAGMLNFQAVAGKGRHGRAGKVL